MGMRGIDLFLVWILVFFNDKQVRGSEPFIDNGSDLFQFRYRYKVIVVCAFDAVDRKELGINE